MTQASGLSFGLAARFSRWELRHSLGKVFYWVSCLAIGVAAVVSIGALGQSLDAAIRSEARSLLAADLAVRSSVDLPARVTDAIVQLEGARTARLHEVVTLVRRTPGAKARSGSGASTLLVELRAAEGSYPFYGEVEVELASAVVVELHGSSAPELGELLHAASPASGDSEIEGSGLGGSAVGGVLVGKAVLEQLGMAIGDPLRVGRSELEIRGVLLSEPDRIPGVLTVGPPVLMTMDAFEDTGLGNLGNFVRKKTLIALDDANPLALDSTKELLEEVIGDDPTVTVETYRDAQPSLRQGLDRMQSYLGLVALLSLLIGGVGVAQGVRAWIATRLDSLAILKCLGFRPREVFALTLAQVVILALIGSLLGGLLGLASLLLLPAVLAGVIPPEAIDPFQPVALLRGIALGVGVATAFGLPPLLTVLRVPPARVFRHGAEPLPGSAWQPAVVLLLLILMIGGMAALQARSLVLAGQFVAGVLATAAALFLGGLSLSRLAARVRRESQPFWVKNGLAALGRPGAGALGAIAALGLGLLVLLTMTLVQGHLEDQLRADLPTDAPTAFLIEIRRDQWPGIEQILSEGGASRIDSAPVVMGRLDQIDGRAASEVARASGERWVFSRDIRMTYLDQLASDNRIVRAADGQSLNQGSPWLDPEIDEVSVELGFAEMLGIEVGSTIEVVIRDTRYPLNVTSLREVDWDGFGINFFLVVEPGAFEQAPQTRLAAVRLPEDREQAIQDSIVEAYPNVTMFQIRQLLDKVVGLLEKLNFGVRLLGSFTVLAGLAILAGAIATTSARRGRETALLKTLGMTRFDIARTFATEYALIGSVAAAIACLGATALAWFVVTQRMEIDWTWRLGDLSMVLIGGPVLSVAAGLAATLRALSKPPIEVLRDA